MIVVVGCWLCRQSFACDSDGVRAIGVDPTTGEISTRLADSVPEPLCDRCCRGINGLRVEAGYPPPFPELMPQ